MPTFNKKQYKFLANWLATANMALYSDVDRALVRSSLADWLERDNERFNREKFLKASEQPISKNDHDKIEQLADRYWR